jgi:diacylglycerol kinase
MCNEPISPRRLWGDKFRDAFRGVRVGVSGQSSFVAHLAISAVVIAAAAALQSPLAEWCLLLLCIAVVLTAEMFNSALESMAKAITHEKHPHLGDSLDIASAGVLVASLGAATVGALIFVNRLALRLGWW